MNRSSTTVESYEESIKKMCTFSTIEEFWSHYSYLKRPSELSTAIQIHLFRSGIRPLWEDAANSKGGKWQLRIKKGMANRVWENVLLAIIGDSFGLGDEVCGCLLTIKANEDILAVWNRSASNKEANMRIREILKQILGIEHNQALEYRPHDQAIKNLLSLQDKEKEKEKIKENPQQNLPNPIESTATAGSSNSSGVSTEMPIRR